MALLVRLRRAAALSSSILKDCSFSSTHSSRFPLSNPRSPIASHLRDSALRIPLQIPCSSFHSSIPCSIRWIDSDQGSKIPEDEILFEGCDYNHWLITMDFPKDPKPSPEEMVETYVQTLAKVVGSVEEAKKRMYACSTTTYQGFQAVMSEEMSEKFRGQDGDLGNLFCLCTDWSFEGPAGWRFLVRKFLVRNLGLVWPSFFLAAGSYFFHQSHSWHTAEFFKHKQEQFQTAAPPSLTSVYPCVDS